MQMTGSKIYGRKLCLGEKRGSTNDKQKNEDYLLL